MRFRLVIYDTKNDSKYASERRFEYLGNKEAIWFLWHHFKNSGYNHLEVYSLDGDKQKPELGYSGMCDYNV